MKKKERSKNCIKSKWIFSDFKYFCIILAVIELIVFVIIGTEYFISAKNYISSQKNLVTSVLQQFPENGVQNVINLFKDNDRIKLVALKKNDDFFDKTDFQNNMLVTNVAKDNYTAIRIEYSLLSIECQLLFWLIILILIFAGLSFFVFRLGCRFAGEIEQPILNITKTAKELSIGKSNVRVVQEDSFDEINQLKNSINEMADRLEKEDKMQNDFISSVSHELRTPLTAIKGWVETISQAGDYSENGYDIKLLHMGLNIINSETQRLSQMVEELLDFSKMESNRIILHIKNENIAKEFEILYFIYQKRGQDMGIKMKYYVDNDFPRINCDKNRLKQVFINLVDNALKYCSYGETIVVTLSGSYQEGKVKIVVSDTGRGISKESLERVKEKFYKEDYTKRGSGIGLAICDEIVYLHGGTMDIESRVNCGTTVTIILPISPPYNEQIVVEKDDDYKLYY